MDRLTKYFVMHYDGYGKIDSVPCDTEAEAASHATKLAEENPGKIYFTIKTLETFQVVPSPVQRHRTTDE